METPQWKVQPVRLVITTLLALAMLFTFSGPAAAEEYRCTGTVGGRTLDNVRVPAGRTCTLNGTIVKGTITIGNDARLFADNIRVIGNIQSEGFRNVTVEDSRVGGSIQVVQGRRADIRRTKVNADILFDDNRRWNIARRNDVGGNVQAFQNTGGVEVRRNVIDGNLQCKENAPRPVGGNNRVGGSKEDQCRGL